MRWRFVLALTIAPAMLGAQTVKPVACSFDTAAHTDTLSLQFAIRALHNNDDTPDARITAALGDLIRGAFRPPPTFGTLFVPNSYFVSTPERRFSQALGDAHLTIQPNGSIAWKWGWHLADPETERAIEAALGTAGESDAIRQAMSSHGWHSRELFTLQFFALTDNIAAKQVPLLRVRVPMLRIDADVVTVTWEPGAKPKTVHPSRGYDQFENLGIPPWVVDELGRLTTRSPEITVVRAGRGTTQTRNGLTFSPALSGGCPVAFAVPSHAVPGPL